jgi:hypothetical protein
MVLDVVLLEIIKILIGYVDLTVDDIIFESHLDENPMDFFIEMRTRLSSEIISDIVKALRCIITPSNEIIWNFVLFPEKRLFMRTYSNRKTLPVWARDTRGGITVRDIMEGVSRLMVGGKLGKNLISQVKTQKNGSTVRCIEFH